MRETEQECNMDSKMIKFVYFTPHNENVKILQLSFFKAFILIALMLILIIFVVGISSKAIFTFKEDRRVAALQEENAMLEKVLSEFTQKSQNIESQLSNMKERDKLFRTFIDMPKIAEDSWGNVADNISDLSLMDSVMLSTAWEDSIMELYSILNEMEQQSAYLLSSQEQIGAKLTEDHKFRSHTPSIFPVRGGVITSHFGMRLDPFVQTVRPHNGIDIVAEHGTPVLAPSDGKVSFIRRSFKPHESFGKVVIIDHGYGISTRYGHLNKIFVKQGQKVKRFEKIGEIGNTGRSTGVHLHYEVLVNGRFQNPEHFIFDTDGDGRITASSGKILSRMD